jgi:hypothetical protein
VKRAHVAIAALVVCGGLALASRTRAPSKSEELPELGFDFCASRVALPIKREEAAWSHPLVFGLLLALSPNDARRLSTAVEDANHRWEARTNPFTEDLEDGDPDDVLAKWLADAPAAARTAVTAAKPRFCGADGWCVRVVARGSACPTGLERVSIADRAYGRARFLAWPFGHALWLRARTPAEAAGAAAALRAHAGESEHIAFVIHAGDDELTRTTRGDLRDALVQHEILRRRASGDDPDRPFRVDGDGGATSQSAFPSAIGPLDVVVLPRLSVVDRPGALEAEVHAAAPGVVVLSERGAPVEGGGR